MGGKDLYMGSPVLVTGKVSGFIGNVPGPPEGSRWSTKWGHHPRRAAWAKCGRVPAPGGLVRPPTKAQGAREWEGGQTLGQMGPKAHPRCASPSPPCGRHPDGIWGLPPPLGREPKVGAQPLPFPYIYLRYWRLQNTRVPLLLGAALPLSLLVSCGAWRSPAGVPRSSTTTTPLCCCWMESSPTSTSPLAGSRRRRRHRAVRVLNTEVPSVRH